MKKSDKLKAIFEPESITIIGASATPGKWGYTILKNLLDNGFPGPIYPVNPKATDILEQTCYPSVLDIPGPVDLAVIVVPISHALAVTEECGQKGIKGIIMVTAGFSEVNSEGKQLEEQLMGIVDRYGMRLIGPNTLGMFNNYMNMNATIIPKLPHKGNVSFISQSGTLGLCMVDQAVEMGIGLNIVVCTGNKSNVDDIDLLEYLDSDDHTDVIAMYIEGINRGKKFIEVAKNISKPIVVIKTGRTQSGSKAVSSHTGSLAGSDDVYSAAFKQAGIIRIENIDDLFDSALALSSQTIPKGNRVGIISNGGGASIIASDMCERMGLVIPNLEQETMNKIEESIPEFASSNNPIDTAGSATYEIYNNVAKHMLSDPNIDALIVIYVHAVIADSRIPATAMTHVYNNQYDKPIITCWIGSEDVKTGINILRNYHIPNYPTPERAVKALESLVRHHEFLEGVKK